MGGKLHSPISPKQTSNAPSETPARATTILTPVMFQGRESAKGNGRGIKFMFTSNLFKSMNISSPEEKGEEVVRKLKSGKRQVNY